MTVPQDLPRKISPPALARPWLSGPAERFHLGWQAALLIAAYGASLLLLNLGGQTRVLTYHEVLFAQPAKEMVASGNWILPTFNGVPSTHKPPGSHWAIAVMMLLTGSEAEGVVRIPAVLAAIVTALIVAATAARWFGGRIGLIAGLVQLTSYYVLQLSRLSECDMLLTAAVTGAMCSFAVVNIDGPRGRSNSPWMTVLFFFCCGLAYLFKGLIGPAFIFSGCTLFLLIDQGPKGLRFFLSPLGIGVFLLCTAGWFAAAYAQYPQIWDDQVMHHFGRFQGEMGGEKPRLFYVWSLLLNMAPWSPLIVAGLIYGLRHGLLHQPFWRFAACWIAPGLGLLVFSTFQSKHYAAPLMPPLAIIGALALAAYFRRRQRLPGWLHVLTASLTLTLCAAGSIALLTWRPAGADVIAVLVALLGVGLLVTNFFEFRRLVTPALASAFATCWVLISGVLSFVMPHHDSYRDQAQLAARANRTIPHEATLHLLRLPENQIAYYLAPQMVRFDLPEEFPLGLEDASQDVFVLAPQFLTAELEKLGAVEVLDRCATVNRYLREDERLTLVRLTPSPQRLAEAKRKRTR